MNPFFKILGSLTFDCSPSIAIALFHILAIFWYTWGLAKSNNRRPPLPPGPKGLPILGNLASLEPNLHLYFTRLVRTYGPIFKLQLGYKTGIVVSSPALAREILKDNDIIFANRDVPDTARAVAYNGSDIVWNPYGPEWRMLRKVCVVKMLSNITLDSVYALRRREVRQTVSYIYDRAGSQMNVGEQMFLTVLNVITNMLWGSTVQGEERASLASEFRKLVSEITELLGTPNISDFFPSLRRFDLQGLNKKMASLAQKFDSMFDRIIEKRLKLDGDSENKGGADQESKDFLQFLLRVREEGDAKTPLTMTHLKALLMDMVVCGSDTSSNSVEFALAELISNPQAMKKAQQELDAVIGKDKIVEEFDIPKLPYLNAIMKETLRLHPALPLLVPHCPSETCTVGGYRIPKGARAFINVWATHRDPSIWDTPLEFRPERFLDGKLDYSGSDFNYLPLGSGRRICAGIAMAERMFTYSLATLVHSFDWKLPQGGQKLDFIEKFGIVLKLKTPLLAIPMPRLSNQKLYA